MNTISSLNTNVSPADPAAALASALATADLVRMGWLDAKTLPADCWLAEPERTDGSLLVLGQGGPGFWQRFEAAERPASAHPLDAYSLEVTNSLLAAVFRCDRAALFPATSGGPLNLLRLLAAAGWQHPSPLGLGINANYGLWSAVRAVWWLDQSAPAPSHTDLAPDLCAGCVSQVCVASCPAGALSLGSGPQLERCATYRFSADSACETTCLARRACPVAAEHQYGDTQMAHHYRLDGSLMAQFRRVPDA